MVSVNWPLSATLQALAPQVPPDVTVMDMTPELLAEVRVKLWPATTPNTARRATTAAHHNPAFTTTTSACRTVYRPVLAPHTSPTSIHARRDPETGCGLHPSGQYSPSPAKRS